MVSKACRISAFKSSKSSTPKLNRTKLSLIPYFALSDFKRSLFPRNDKTKKNKVQYFIFGEKIRANDFLLPFGFWDELFSPCGFRIDFLLP